MVENYNARFISRLTRDTVALVLAGGRGSRLKQLTNWRAKPAVPIAGKFRIIDFPLSNCINSGIRKIGVLTQYKAHSLIRHIQQGWGFMRGYFGDFIELLPASQRTGEGSWYVGTADAVYQNLDIIRSYQPKYILILAGDHVYKMDYGEMLAYHVERESDVTVGCIHVPLKEASAFGVIEIDENLRVTSFIEKPENPQPSPGKTDETLASMGIYIFNADFLYEQLVRDSDFTNTSHDFGRDIVPNIIRNNYRVMAFPFRDVQGGDPGYWRDVGTIDAFWKTNIELVSVRPELNLYDKDWPIWTHQVQLPPAKFIFNTADRCGIAIDSMVSGGCMISGSKVYHSLLFSNVSIHSYSEIRDSVILPDVVIGRHCRISKAIIDRGCYIPDNTIIGEDIEKDKDRFYVSEETVVLVTPEMLGQNRIY